MPSANVVFAQEQYEIFEFGESGHIIKFLISQEEADRRSRSRTNMKTQDSQKVPSEKRWVQRYEFGESGYIVEFPMTQQEIEKEKERLARIKNERKLVDNSDEDLEVIEMGDGHTISFKKN